MTCKYSKNINISYKIISYKNIRIKTKVILVNQAKNLRSVDMILVFINIDEKGLEYINAVTSILQNAEFNRIWKLPECCIHCTDIFLA